MKIAFVGKGGSGKTSIASLFTQYLHDNTTDPVFAIDADLNLHMAALLGLTERVRSIPHLSLPESMDEIREYLRGQNTNITELEHFRKTTPPTRNSSFVIIADDNLIIQKFAGKKGRLYFSQVGTYRTEKIGQSCYHDSLAILENILSHTIDVNSNVVIDMVAGIDAFAGSLHAQFDLLVLVVEPTKQSTEVFRQYSELARAAGIEHMVAVIGNKVMDESDEKFLKNEIPENYYLGSFKASQMIKEVSRSGESLDLSRLEESNSELLEKIHIHLKNSQQSFNERLQRLYELHKAYVSQGYIQKRYGDLTTQIQLDFDFDAYAEAITR